MGFDRFTLPLLVRYQGESAAVHAHNLVRVASCPFGALHDVVPEHGTIVDVGGGRGLFANYLALRAAGRRVVGIEPDPEKVAIANRARIEGGSRFIAGEIDDPVPDAPAGIVIIDVLYLLPSARQDTFIARAAERLRPGGRLIVKEMATEAAWKMFVTRLQEHLAVRTLGWTKGAGSFCYRSPADLVRVMELSGLRAYSRRLDQISVHPHAVVIGRKP